ncbi:MAG: HTTM domain-containing protein [Chitinophagaceae bacterium]|nr:HTTM domain-containing protein [Anaerolineae bacterium]
MKQDFVERWLTQPEKNAAGRMSLFRIVFGLSYLWFLSGFSYTALYAVPPTDFAPVALGLWAKTRPSLVFFNLSEMVLIGALVLLIAGYKTRWMTWIVLITGVILEALRFSYGKIDHNTQFLIFFIPFFMAFAHWGSHYSLDSLLNKRKGRSNVSAANTSWRYIWPAYVLLLFLAFLYFTAFFYKIVRGNWLVDTQLIATLIREGNLTYSFRTGRENPLNVLLLSVPFLPTVMQWMALAFEGLFPLVLFNKSLRNFFLASAVIFHAFNWFVLNINFMPLIVTYALFIDWQRLYDVVSTRLGFGVDTEERSMMRVSVLRVQIGAVVAAGLIAGLWNSPTVTSRTLFNIVSYNALWSIVAAVATVCVLMSLRDGLKWLMGLRLERPKQQTTP